MPFDVNGRSPRARNGYGDEHLSSYTPASFRGGSGAVPKKRSENRGPAGSLNSEIKKIIFRFWFRTPVSIVYRSPQRHPQRLPGKGPRAALGPPGRSRPARRPGLPMRWRCGRCTWGTGPRIGVRPQAARGRRLPELWSKVSYITS